MSSANSDNLTSFFSIWMPFVSFCCLIALVGISSTILNKIAWSRHLYLVPDPQQKAFIFAPFNIMLAGILLYMAFIMLRYVSPIPNLVRNFYHKKMLNFIKCHFWICDFCASFTPCGVSYLLICICWAILAFLGWNPLIIVTDLFNVLLDLSCQYFVEEFCIYLHHRYWPVDLLLVCPCLVLLPR